MTYAYIINKNRAGTGTISIIDTQTNTVLPTTIMVGNNPYDIATLPNGQFIYITNNTDNTVSVIDKQTNTITSTITVGNNPAGITISPNGQFVYVTNSGDSTVSVINTQNNNVIYTVKLLDNSQPNNSAVTPNGQFVYVTSKNTTSVFIIDIINNYNFNTMNFETLSNVSSGIAITSAFKNNYAYIASTSGNISVIDTSNNKVAASISVDGIPKSIVVSPNGSFVYVVVAINRFSSIYTIKTCNNTIVNTTALGTALEGISITPDDKYVYVTNSDGSISSIDIRNNYLLKNITIFNNYISRGTFQACTPITLSPTTISNGTVGTLYSETITATNVTTAPVIWSISAGSLPNGLSLTPSSDTLSVKIGGTPTTIGSYSFTVLAKDSSSPACTGSQQYTMEVTAACTPITLSPTTISNGTVGTPYNETITATNVTTTPVTWSISSGSLPSGLSLNPSIDTLSVKITGTPTTTGSYSFTVLAKDSSSPACTGSQPYTVEISATCTPIILSPTTISNGIVGTPYSETITATNVTTAPVTWSISNGSLPNGLSLSPSIDTLSVKIIGTPTAIGSYSFKVVATDSSSPACTGSQQYTIEITTCTTITLSPTTLPNCTVGTPYTEPITQIGGTGTITWFISAGALPSGLTLDPSLGIISGTPTTTGAFSFTVTAKDSLGCTGSQTYTITSVSSSNNELQHILEELQYVLEELQRINQQQTILKKRTNKINQKTNSIAIKQKSLINCCKTFKRRSNDLCW